MHLAQRGRNPRMSQPSRVGSLLNLTTSPRIRPILYVAYSRVRPATHSFQGTALVVAIEPILCCRLILSTHHTLSPRNYTTGVTAATEVPTELFAVDTADTRPNSAELGSMGRSTFSSQSSTASMLLPWLTSVRPVLDDNRWDEGYRPHRSDGVV